MIEALELMWRDAGEAPLLIAFMFSPTVLAAFAWRRGSRLALVPMGVLIAQVGVWFAYYATDGFSNSGMAGVWANFIIPTLVSLVVAAAALHTAARQE